MNQTQLFIPNPLSWFGATPPHLVTFGPVARETAVPPQV